jgi:hypothetical protein
MNGWIDYGRSLVWKLLDKFLCYTEFVFEKNLKINNVKYVLKFVVPTKKVSQIVLQMSQIYFVCKFVTAMSIVSFDY